MPSSSLSKRRLLSDADATTFAPPLPPEAFGCRRPGPAILKIDGHADSSDLFAPVPQAEPASLAPLKGSNTSPALAKGSGEVATQARGFYAPSTPVKNFNVASTPHQNLNAVSTAPKTPKATSTPNKGYNAASPPEKGSGALPPSRYSPGASMSSPESTDSVRWNRKQGLPSQAMPREAPSAVIGMQDDPRSFYRYKRTCGPPIDYPPEEAGPIADRRRVDAPSMTISNAYGNLRIHVVSPDTVQVWYLGKASDKTAVWVEAKGKDPHPEMPNIVLSMAKPYRPQWIREASFDTQQCPSRVITRMSRVKAEPY